jgi:hypothetical protein
MPTAPANAAEKEMKMKLEIRVTAFEDEFGGELTNSDKINYETALDEELQEYYPDAEISVDLDWEPTGTHIGHKHWGIFDVTDEDEEQIIEMGDHFMQSVWDRWCAS